ncbi:hypothetical protein R77567_01644 [Ralstonia sp. LMG 32965]|uniref:Uncharacterized protein n=1 Tax=Ralstonia flatus TaxID=3058601 RepID=A0AAD2BWB1_9RALS|nr:hypothetical protein [Ralstonia sp. LMG 32965]CAJ0862393.1 hypothetical protein R77567_01644 [Ralstonia sp. LMG 32965]
METKEMGWIVADNHEDGTSYYIEGADSMTVYGYGATREEIASVARQLVADGEISSYAYSA